MNKIAINKFDVRLSYLTENDIKHWNRLNRFARTLWFENTISGPDIEYSRLSVEIFKLYPHYSTWSHMPRQNVGYLLQNNSSNPILTINADLMNGWWNIFKRLTNNKLTNTNRSSNILPLYNDFCKISDYEISTELSKKFGHNTEVWDAFLKYLDLVYTIGNLSPTGANPGGNGYDLWTTKLSYLKQQWFDKSYTEKEEIYNTRASNNSTLSKWAPLLWQSYNSNCEENWKNFINDHFYHQYVNNDYSLSLFSPDTKDDNSIVSFLNQLSEIIINRGTDIIKATNKTISFDTIVDCQVKLTHFFI